MSTHPGSNLHTTDFASFISHNSARHAQLKFAEVGLQLQKPTTKDSIVAGAVMLGYLGVYLVVGFAALTAASWAWGAIFG